MPGPKGEMCEDCYFSQDNDPDEPGTKFWCRRYPPTIPYSENGKPELDAPFELVTVFPSGWCGEFKKNESTK